MVADRPNPPSFLRSGWEDGERSEDAIPSVLHLDEEETPSARRGRDLQRFLFTKKDEFGVSAEQDVQRECSVERNPKKDDRGNGAVKK